MKKQYQPPTLTTYGPIGDHTFQTPGQGTKSGITTYELDSVAEFSHPAS